ncbi:CD209 antigen-like protein A, partial [Meleagris gallopavo]
MALQETYGNWLGPPPVPAKRPVKQTGIYSAARKMTPMNDFRPASPDSFADEDDYDDVSVSGSDRGYKPPTSSRDLQSQKEKGGTGVYILAGKPPSSNPSPMGNPKPSSGGGWPSTTILYVLVALSFVVWVLLLALAVVKQMEIMAELELLRSNYSETQIHMLQEVSESRREQMWLRSGMRGYYRELQDLAAQMCKVIPDKKCLAGWKAFKGSCYSFSTERMSWREAKEICDDQGAHLVIINSGGEQGFLKNSINSSNMYWLGVTDEQQEGTWLWINGDAVSTRYRSHTWVPQKHPKKLGKKGQFEPPKWVLR